MFFFKKKELGDMLPFETIKKIMKKRTNGNQISKKAVAAVAANVEDYVKNVTDISLVAHKKKNKQRKIQGLRIQKRIDKKCIHDAIKIINNEK